MSQPHLNSQVLNHSQQEEQQPFRRITRQQFQEKGLVELTSLSLSSKRIKYPPPPLPLRFDTISKSTFKDLICPHHDMQITLVCTEFFCTFKNRIGCLNCLLINHLSHHIINLDRFIEMILSLQIKELNELDKQYLPSISQLHQQIQDCRELLESQINSRQSCSYLFQNGISRLNQALLLLEFATKFNEQDVIKLKQKNISQYAATHWLFSQSKTPLFDCIDLFAKISYLPSFSVLSKDIVFEKDLSSKMKSIDKARNFIIPNMNPPQQHDTSFSKKSLSSLDSAFIFQLVEDENWNCICYSMTQQLWKVTEKQIVYVKPVKKQQTQEKYQDKEKKQIDQDQEKVNKGINKKRVQDEVNKQAEKDQMYVQYGNNRKKRKLNDQTSKDNEVGLKNNDLSKQMEIEDKFQRDQQTMKNIEQDQQNSKLNEVNVMERTFQVRTRSQVHKAEQLLQEQYGKVQTERNVINQRDQQTQQGRFKQKKTNKTKNTDERKEEKKDEDIQEHNKDMIFGDEQKGSMDSQQMKVNNEEKSLLQVNNDNGNSQIIILNNDESLSYNSKSSPNIINQNNLIVSELSRNQIVNQLNNNDVSFELSGQEDSDVNEDEQEQEQEEEQLSEEMRNLSNQQQSQQDTENDSNIVSPLKDSNAKLMEEIAKNIQISEQKYKLMKQQALSEQTEYDELLNLRNQEFQRIHQLQQQGYLNDNNIINLELNEEQEQQQQQSKAILKYRYLGKKHRITTRICDFEEFLQVGEQQLKFNHYYILQEIMNIISWINYNFIFQINNYCPENHLIFSSSRVLAHYTDQYIRNKIISMSFIDCDDTDKTTFLTIDNTSEMKIWQIHPNNYIQLLTLSLPNNTMEQTPKRIMSRFKYTKLFLFSEELFNDGSYFQYKISYQDNSCNLLKQYRINSINNIDTPFLGLLTKDKIIVIQNNNKTTKIQLFLSRNKKFIRYFKFENEFDYVNVVHNDQNLLAMSCSSLLNFGVLDLVTGRRNFVMCKGNQNRFYSIKKQYAFVGAQGGVYFAVSMKLNNSQQKKKIDPFKFQIFKIKENVMKQKEEDTSWQRIYQKSGYLEVIEVQYSSQYDSLIFLEHSYVHQDCNNNTFTLEDKVELKQDDNKNNQQNQYTLMMYNMKTLESQILLRQI